MAHRSSAHPTRSAARRSTGGFASVVHKPKQLAFTWSAGLGRLAPKLALPRRHQRWDTPVSRRLQLRATPARILRVLESNLVDVHAPASASEKFKHGDIEGLVRVQPIPVSGIRQNPNHLAILAPLVSRDELRPAINGVLLDPPGQCSVATNGHLLVRLQESLKGTRYIVHPKTGKRIDERYPDYENSIPLAERPYEGVITNLPRLMAQLSGIVKANRWINYAADFSSSGHIRAEVRMGGGYYYFDPLLLLRVITALQQAGTTVMRFSLDESPARVLLLTDAQRPRQLALLMPIGGSPLARTQRRAGIAFCPVTLGQPEESAEGQTSSDDLQPTKAKPKSNMTNAQHLQAAAIDNMRAGLLSSYEKDFVYKIQNWDKKQLNKLTTEQLRLLDQCAYKKSPAAPTLNTRSDLELAKAKLKLAALALALARTRNKK